MSAAVLPRWPWGEAVALCLSASGFGASPSPAPARRQLWEERAWVQAVCVNGYVALLAHCFKRQKVVTDQNCSE